VFSRVTFRRVLAAIFLAVLVAIGCAQAPRAASNRTSSRRLTPKASPGRPVGRGALWARPRADKISSAVILTASKATPSQPFTLSRVFAQGDIPHCAQVVLDGTSLDTQCDVKTRWPDGSVQHALLSFWGQLAKGSHLVEFIDQETSLPGDGLDAVGMLSDEFGFAARIEITSESGQTLTADARNMLIDGAFRYWLKGPISTQVIIEDRGPQRRYDLGWDDYRQFHPIFVATFYPGWPGAKVEYIGENMWTDHLSDLKYSLALRLGPDQNRPPAYSKNLFTHDAMTRWRKTGWTNAAPDRVNVDFNLPYMISSGILPNFDLTTPVSSSAVNSEVNQFLAGDRGDINGSGEWVRDFGAGGGRPEVALFPRWAVRYLYTFDSRLYDVMIGNAEVSGHVPIHLRESVPEKLYLKGTDISAMGRPLSVDARPTMCWADLRFESTAEADRVRFRGPVGNSHGWRQDVAHQGSFAFLPYVFTGDWYFLEEMYFWSSYNLSWPNPSDDWWLGRHWDWGFLTSGGLQIRGTAWAMRTLGHTVLLAPDGSPEKTYYTDKFYNNIAILEGEQDIRDGAFYDPSPDSQWSWGRDVVAGHAVNPLHFMTKPPGNENWGIVSTTPPDGADQCASPWMYNYAHSVYGHLDELGFPIGRLRQALALHLLNQLVNPDYNPYLSGAYRMPVWQTSGVYFADWKAVKKAFVPGYQEAQSWPDPGSDTNPEGYPFLARAAASFLPGLEDNGLKGDDAWRWISRNTRREVLNDDPKWALAPRAPGQLQPAWDRRLNKSGIRKNSAGRRATE